MPFVSILAAPGHQYLSIKASPQPVTVAQPLTAEGTFGDRPQIVVFQREVPDPSPLLARLQTVLASSRAEHESDAYDCPVPVAIRAIEIAAAELWPPNRLRCSECQQYFVAPIAEARRMYLACPHCHNPMLNPRWNSA
jgi:hypothetical protein